MSWDDLKSVLQIVLAPMLGWILWERRAKDRVMSDRIGQMETKVNDIPLLYPTKDTLNQYIDGWRDELERMRNDGLRMHTENMAVQGRIESKVGDIATIAVRLGRAEQDIVDLRGWKHEKADPYIGELDRINDRLQRLEK